MDFNLDDPLEDLLSDASNESTKPSKKSTLGNLSSKGKMEDLFGIKETSTSEKLKISSSGNETTKQQQQSFLFPETTSVQKKTENLLITKPKTPLKSQINISNDDDDLIADLGFDPKKPKNKTSSTSILDDLLSPEIKKSNSALTSSTDIERSTNITLPKTPVLRPKSSTHRQSGSGLTNNESLDLFGNISSSSSKRKDNIEESNKNSKEVPKLKRKGTTVDWLGLNEESKTQKEQINTEQNSNNKEQLPVLFVQESSQQQLNLALPTLSNISSTISQNQDAILMATTNLETQNALQTLKQQEAQLLMATQFKSHENALLEMQKRQQELLQQQEIQFNELLKKQIAKQNQLEMHIKSQQERINAHIQFLMSQTNIPSLSSVDSHNVIKTDNENKITNDKNDNRDNNKIDDIQLEAEIKRLELEKLRLEDLISNVNANHEKEIEFLELSHKKQIKLLEDSLRLTEERLQNELKSLEQFYLHKIQLLQNEKDSLITLYETKLGKLEDEYKNELEKIKSQSEENLKSLKENYKNAIENIKESKILEFNSIKDNQSYLETIRNASNNLEDVSNNLYVIRDEMTQKIDIEQKEKEIKLQAREKRLEDAEKRLKLSEESTEQEKSRLIELITTLEIQLAQLQHDTTEEKWTFKQKLLALEVERTSFEREKQFIRDQLAREQKHLDEIKQTQLEEYKRLMEEIQNEKQLLNAEKTKFETMKKLEMETSNNNKSKITENELEITLQVTKDAIKQTDEEREKYYKMQRQYEMKKRELIEQENQLRNKQNDLESALISIKAKERQIQDIIQKNRLIEQDFISKNQFVQIQMQRITEREAKLSQDRVELSKQRLQLQELKHNLEQNKCSLCKISEKNDEISRILINQDIYKSQDEGIDIQYNYNNNNNNNDNQIDNLFDKETNELLQNMKSMNTLLLPSTIMTTDLNDENPIKENFHYNSSSSFIDTINNFLPTTRNIDSEIMMLNFDLKKNFDI